MESLRRRATLKGQQTFQDFHPASEWTQDASNHILTIHLPGFKRELVTVQVDNAGKLMVKGRRQESDGRYSRLDETFDVPKDVAIEKINGKFDEGRLNLFMPKMVKDQPIPKESKEEAAPKEKPAGDEEIKDERPIQEEKPKDEAPIQEEKPTDEASVPEEKPTSGEERRDEGPVPKKKLEEDHIEKQVPKSGGDEGEKSAMKEEKTEIREEKTRGAEEEKARLEITGEEEEKEESLVQRAKKAVHRKEGLASNQKKPESWEEARMRDLGPIRKDRAKRGSVWKEFGEEGWLDYGGVVDRLWEKVNRNRKVIAAALIAFSVGFYVSNKLRSTGK